MNALEKLNWLAAILLFVPGGQLRGAAPSPEVALRRMRVADGFEIKLFASEPDIRQP